jgi:hypothetical protein
MYIFCVYSTVQCISEQYLKKRYLLIYQSMKSLKILSSNLIVRIQVRLQIRLRILSYKLFLQDLFAKILFQNKGENMSICSASNPASKPDPASEPDPATEPNPTKKIGIRIRNITCMLPLAIG